MRSKILVLLALAFAAVSTAATAEPPAAEPKAAVSLPETVPAPASSACEARKVSAFDYPTCSSCSDHVCSGQYVGTICGLDEFGQLMVCQDQLVGCYPQPYPDTIFCRCTSNIVP